MSKPAGLHSAGIRIELILMMAIRHPALRWHEHETGLYAERGNLGTDDNRKGTSHRKARPKVEKLCTGTEILVVVMKGRNGIGAKGYHQSAEFVCQLWLQEEQMDTSKQYVIDKWTVYKAYQRVKRNKGSAGVDGIDFAKYEKNLKNNLYKLWNRMSSGSYFPKPVMGVEIPKKNGGSRLLGIPTIEDRVAQRTAVLYIEGRIDPIFH